jgi:hypothetical protein
MEVKKPLSKDTTLLLRLPQVAGSYSRLCIMSRSRNLNMCVEAEACDHDKCLPLPAKKNGQACDIGQGLAYTVDAILSPT